MYGIGTIHVFLSAKKNPYFPGIVVPEEYGMFYYLSSAGITQFRFKGSSSGYSGELSGHRASPRVHSV
jgi:hypothetical protein